MLFAVTVNRYFLEGLKCQNYAKLDFQSWVFQYIMKICTNFNVSRLSNEHVPNIKLVHKAVLQCTTSVLNFFSNISEMGIIFQIYFQNSENQCCHKMHFLQYHYNNILKKVIHVYSCLKQNKTHV